MTTESNKVSDPINHLAYYNQGRMEAIEAIEGLGPKSLFR